MTLAKPDDRFFESSRGQVILHLRSAPKTVNELAKELDVTTNAIRAHLLVLERDGLVRQGGTTKGFRKPHYLYVLTEKARHLFPQPFDLLLNKLLSVLKRNVSARSLITTLREVGKDIAGDVPSAGTDREKLEHAVTALEALGGSAVISDDDGRIVIRSESCPFAEGVMEHPEICKIAESAVAEITGKNVEEKCDRTAEPRCRFHVGE